MAERDFKGVWIPREVWLDERLNMLDKGILTEIDSLDITDSGCFASNSYLAEFCQCTERKVSDTISKLITLGYIKVLSFDGRTRKLRSCIEKSSMQTGKKCEADTKKVPPNNTYSNSLNNTGKSISRKRDKNVVSPGFTEFWNVYPRHVAKQNAMKAWAKIGADDSQALTDTIIADVNRRLESEWRGKDMQYIPHPATYLNGRRWEDETGVTKIAEHPGSNREIVLTPEEEAEIERIYAQNGRDAYM